MLVVRSGCLLLANKDSIHAWPHGCSLRFNIDKRGKGWNSTDRISFEKGTFCFANTGLRKTAHLCLRNMHQVTKSVGRPIGQKDIQSVSQSANRSVSQRVSHSVSQLVRQSVNQSVGQPVNQKTNYKAKQPLPDSIKTTTSESIRKSIIQSVIIRCI